MTTRKRKLQKRRPRTWYGLLCEHAHGLSVCVDHRSNVLSYSRLDPQDRTMIPLRLVEILPRVPARGGKRDG